MSKTVSIDIDCRVWVKLFPHHVFFADHPIIVHVNGSLETLLVKYQVGTRFHTVFSHTNYGRNKEQNL